MSRQSSRYGSRYELEPLDSREASLHSRASWDPSPSDNRSIVADGVHWRQKSYLSSAYLITYVLIFFAVVISGAAGVVLVLTRQHAAGKSIPDVESYPIARGSCSSSLHTYNLVAHLFINLVGTIILASSNYLQQICTSPSITEVARQIKRHGDFSFGANSPSAVFRQRSTLKWLWLLLVVTSVPIHIMLNGIMGYAITPISATGQAIESSDAASIHAYATKTNWTNISSNQCATYLLNSVAYVTDFNNITVVVNSGANLQFYNSYMQYGSNEPQLPKAADISSCYVEFVDSACELTVRWFPLLCTAGAICIKTIIVFFAIRRHSHFHKRVFNSLGDMIALGARHPQLRDRLYGKKSGTFRCPRVIPRIRWVKALSWGDLAVAIFWWISALGVTTFGVLYWMWAAEGLSMSLVDRFKRFGLGTIDPSTSFVPGSGDSRKGTPSTFPVQVIVANSPQLWLSFGYLLWNNQVTRIWMEREWRSFYRHTHIPRVSCMTDQTGVKPTRWLQLPYWMTGILMTLSTIMHWLVSQTLFVVEILGKDSSPGYFYMNYSPFAIFSIGIVSTILVVLITVYYFLPVRTWMPLMAGSARVVFESCVRLEPNLPMEGIEWGDVSTPIERLAGFGNVARELQKGATYPGMISREDYGDPHYSFQRFGGDSDVDPLFPSF